MATIKQIRQRIKSARNIQQITRAMKLVSAAKFKKASEKVFNARPYYYRIHKLIEHLFSNTEMPLHPFLSNSSAGDHFKGHDILIVITADRGLAGSYNTNLLKKAYSFSERHESQPVIYPIGKKGAQFFKLEQYRVLDTYSISSSGPSLQDAKKICHEISDLFLNKNIGKIFIAYNKFYSALKQTPLVKQLLPIENNVEHDPQWSEYSFEPDAKSLLNHLLPKFLLADIYQALLEANASEHGARMTAMTGATDNANKMIEELSLVANRERQAKITKEILEVVSGAELLRSM